MPPGSGAGADLGAVVDLAEDGAIDPKDVGPGIGHGADFASLDAAIHVQAMSLPVT